MHLYRYMEDAFLSFGMSKRSDVTLYLGAPGKKR